MNLSQLYYFKKLAELEHYTRAAKELYITQPALSEAIHALEDELGVPLFQREGRNVRLTKYGHEFSRYVNLSLRELDKGISVMKSYTSSLEGRIKIGATYSVQGDYLPALLRGFKEEVSDSVEFEIYQGFSLPLIEGVSDETYDVVFASALDKDPNLAYIPVVSQQAVMCCSENFPLAQRRSVRVEDLRGHKVYTYRRGTPVGEEMHCLLEKGGVVADASYQDEITLGGMTLADESACGAAILTIGLKSFPRLRIIPIEDAPYRFHVLNLVYRKNDFKSRALERFIEYASEYVVPPGIMPNISNII